MTEKYLELASVTDKYLELASVTDDVYLAGVILSDRVVGLCDRQVPGAGLGDRLGRGRSRLSHGWTGPATSATVSALGTPTTTAF